MSEKLKTPQDLIGDFWSQFVTKKPGKVTAIFPNSLYATLLPKPSAPDSAASHTNFGASYEAVAADCRAKVARIVRDCRRTNAKFTDPEFDLRGNRWYCLLGLMWNSPTTRASASDIENALSSLKTNQLLADPGALAVSTDALLKVLGDAPVDDDDTGNSEGDRFAPEPRSVHRVDWIYEDPHFDLDGYSSSDIMQGGTGDCWWLSAVATIAHRRDLMDKICVARDEECGVYGFVFYRDGCWISTVIDDNLCLKEPDFSVAMGTDMHDPSNSAMTKWRRQKQTGSEALYFSACRDPNETWLPLLEKAYAKVHGDYNAICGGWVGEGVEDLTGGVNSEMVLEDVLSKKDLWTELLNEDKHFVFGLDILDQGGVTVKNGLANAHAYSFLEAREETDEDGKTMKLVKIR